jgi:hypothetical protein
VGAHRTKDFIFGSFEAGVGAARGRCLGVPATGLIDGQHFADYGYTVYDPMTSQVCAAPPAAGARLHPQPFPG